ncbi:alpha-L-fucosidase [Mediterranea massiliensis]|uniref:alpha-L-fucosidase n=2 Tax=Bacteroidaceae TaxID=815 RepID=UPI0025A4A1DA|nr:alpha-L-fucosidase [Mediterranea massiliensis]MDM8336118.1 alpha-L-fucosidase [Mediterranea massiliensis]
MNKIKSYFLLCMLGMLPLSGLAQQKTDVYVKHLEFPAGATLDQKVAMAARLVPSPQQLEWQQMELTAFLHFGINTFTDREWGDGTEDPALFNPTELDAEQWVRTLKDAGFKMVLLTAKHHDGFCLWPTKTTRHSVASSPWKGGKGDVVKELRDACTKYGMKFGVYLSPWDRNAECYGDSPRYNQFFIEQLTELLTNYGEVHEVWFDGANGEGPNGKKQEYDWDAFYKTIQRLQPKAVMAIMGDDVRWVGNEKGIGRETEWSATVLTPGIYARSAENNKRLGVFGKAKDLGSRQMLTNATELFWYPSEVDVSIRPGWFWHEKENDKVKSLKHLTDIYFQSVGYNSVLLLNIPPDRRGLIHEADVARLREFAAYRRQAFANNAVQNGQTQWTAHAGEQCEYALKPGSTINVVLLQEDIAHGQRVEDFTVEARVGGTWQQLGKGTTVGYKRMLRFPAVEADAIRLTIGQTRLEANIANVAAYYAEQVAEEQAQASWNDLLRDGWKKMSNQPLVIDLGKEVTLKGFTYAPLNEQAKPTMAYRYKFYVSLDGSNWKEVPCNGEFSNIMHNPLPQTVLFGQKARARFIKLEATTPEASPAVVALEEIGVSLSDAKDN